jgi:hypothetical protein
MDCKAECCGDENKPNSPYQDLNPIQPIATPFTANHHGLLILISVLYIF